MVGKMTRINLDLECAKIGENIISEAKKNNLKIKELETLIQKSLGIIEEDGIYAFYVYLKSKDAFRENSQGNIILKNIWKLLKNEKLKLVIGEYNEKEVENAFQKLCENLKNLIFVKTLIERALIYARYHAKAIGEQK